MPQFQIVSDLHLETHPSYAQFRVPDDAPYLALLGDIGHVADIRFLQWLEKLLERFWAVFCLLGNHEPWHLTFENAKVKMRAFAERMEAKRTKSSIGRFVFLDQTRYDLTNKISILGCTLFSHVPLEKVAVVDAYLIDFEDIVDWSVPNHNTAHASDTAWLNTEVSKIMQEDPERQIYIFSHHSPSTHRKANDPKHKKSEVSSAFATDLCTEVCWTSPNVKMWAFGHTHYNCDFEDEGTGKRVLTNQKGYYRFPAQKGYDVSRIYSIGD